MGFFILQNIVSIENFFEDLDLKQSLESPDFKNITQLAKAIFKVPNALITIIDNDYLYVSESKEFVPITIPFGDTFCSYTINQEDIFIVKDATNDERFIKNKYVIEDGFKFYAGIPIKISDEKKIGNFCLMGFEPRDLTDIEMLMMRDIANQISSLLELHLIATKHKQQSIKLKEANELNKKALIMIDTMHDGLAIQNLDGDLIFVNPSACRILGFPKEQLLKKSARDDWSAIDETGNEISWLEHPSMRALYQNRQIVGEVIAVKRPDNSRAWLQISAVPMSIENTGMPESVLVTFADITQTKLQEEKLRELSEKAEIANRAKSAFLANMSHEIRTPLNGVLGIASALLGTKLDDNQLEMVGIINESGNSLANLLNDIIDLSKIESGNFTLEPEMFSPCAIIKQSISLFEQSANQKNLKLNFIDNIPNDLQVMIDKNRFRQILNNLIGNAIKFTNEGNIAIVGNYFGDLNTKIGKLRIEVIDTGLGFDENTKEKLFGRFVQADESISRKYGGSGLGLSICKSLIELMNGKIGCNSKPNVGSCFWFEIDIEGFVKTETKSETSLNFNDSVETKKILIVEDNKINQKVLKMLLGNHNIDLEFAENGQIAIDLFNKFKFDIILMDTQMPIMDGIEAIKIIRTIEIENNIARTPIINLSANVMREQIMEVINAGADDYISKPIASDELFEKIDHWLNVA